MRLPGGQGPASAELCGYGKSFGDLPEEQQEIFPEHEQGNSLDCSD